MTRISAARRLVRHPCQTVFFQPSDGAQDDRFGFSVAVSASTTVIGAPLDHDNGLYSGFSPLGAVRVENRQGSVRLGRYMIRCPIVLKRLQK